jgi:hypothetical protein
MKIPYLCAFKNNNYVFNYCKYAYSAVGIMKKIVDYRRALGVSKATTVQELKTVYRGLMKEWHPDKFQDNEEGKNEAELKSRELIEAYNFLLSIAPETIEKALPEYTQTITACTILNYSYEKSTLLLNFVDGSSYEYFDVPKAIYVKLNSSDVPARFCRRHIYHSFVYRKVSKALEA